jgi:hypothetical protein
VIIKKVLLITTLLFYSCFSYSVEEEPVVTSPLIFEINEMKIGDVLTEEFFAKNCPASLKDSAEIECKQKIKLDEISLSVLYFFYDKKLLAISFNFSSTNYNELIAIYTKRFQRSPQLSEKLIVLNTGDEHINESAKWNMNAGEFVIEKYWNNLKKGSAQLVSSDYLKYKGDKSEVEEESFFKKVFRNMFD